jgi:hypothetical protein
MSWHDMPALVEDSLSLANDPGTDSLGLRGRTQHLDLHRGVERHPGFA